jgi:glyoxylase-like metal-dependent hydrolase (beta-lactamase superfamily II)
MRALPPAERVRPGVWSLPVPIPNNPLGYTLVYLIEGDRGPVLVDTGWEDPTTWAALESGMAAAGYAVADTHGVLVTHHHHDHHGLSEQVRQASGAWVAMHPEDAALVSRRITTEDGWRLQVAAVLLAAGASEADLAALPPPGARRPEPLPAVPSRLVDDGADAGVPGWDVRAVWTPGHSPGHLCFVVTRYDLLLSGDHVLPTISPHVGLYREDTDEDPLGDYLASLARLEGLPVAEVLPAHEHRFTDLASRRAALAAHHEERLTAIEATLAEGPATPWEIAAQMPWNRAWEDLGPVMKRAALGEAFAHLRHLERRGTVRAVPGSRPARYEATRPPRAPR